MTDTEKLLYGLGAAVIALFSAQLTALIAHWLAAKREQAKAQLEDQERRQELLRGKLETILTMLEEYVEQLETRADLPIPVAATLAAGAVMPWTYERLTNDSFVRAQTFVVLYFPDLQADLLNLAKLAHICRQLILDELEVIRKDPRNWLAHSQPQYWSRWQQALSDFKDKWLDFQLRARSIMEKELLPRRSHR